MGKRCRSLWARGCLGRPWLFGDLAAVFDGQPVPPRPDLGEVLDGMVEHAELLCEWMGEDHGVRDFRKHTGWYLKGFPAGGEMRSRLNRVGSLEEMRDLIGALDRDIPFPVGGMRMVRPEVAARSAAEAKSEPEPRPAPSVAS